jgi:CheY-like chemotaxis protein
MSSDEHLRVLVVEDDPDFVSLLRLLLEQVHIGPVAASS